MKRFLPLIFAIFLSACAQGDPVDYLRFQDVQPPTKEGFIHCYDYGCKRKITLALSDMTGKKLNKLLKDKPGSSSAEREKIAQAIAIFEQDIGEAVGTESDKRGTFRILEDNDNSKYNQQFQQDCVDETTNTTTYLILLDQMGLLHYHTPGFPVNRSPTLSAPWWHRSATIVEKETQAQYVVDSWFHDNGKAAEIVSVAAWKDGWNPPKNKTVN